MTIREEGHSIAGILSSHVPHEWDGRQCILEMRDTGSKHWRQMEWIGFYFEFKARQILVPLVGGSVGPTYGKVTFDYKMDCVWDFKAHPTNSPPGRRPPIWAYTNDSVAVDSCIRDHGGIGLLIACGRAAYDDSGQFKAWHDRLKGEPSSYVVANAARNAWSRTRKTRFLYDDLVVVVLEDQDAIRDGIGAGWLRDGMQKGQRNSNGLPRGSKYGVDVAQYVARGGLHYAVPRR